MASSPQWVYRQAFGEYPSKDIRIDKYEYIFDFSSEEIALKFKTTNLNKILLSRPELKPITQKIFENQIADHVPYWFQPFEKSPNKFYGTSSYHWIGDPMILLSYNSEDGTVYFYYYSFSG